MVYYTNNYGARETKKTRNEFTAYMKTVVRNSATEYKRKIFKLKKHEINVADFTSLPKELSAGADSSFFMGTERGWSMDDRELMYIFEEGVTYDKIENLFTYEKYYRAMKKLSDKEKLVLFLTIVKELRAKQVALMMNTTKENIKMIKSRAIKNFLMNLSDEM